MIIRVQQLNSDSAPRRRAASDASARAAAHVRFDTGWGARHNGTAHGRPKHERPGFLVPFVALALLIVLAALALALDRIWVDAAETELLRGVEAAALAGARELASDETLRPSPDSKQQSAAARSAASSIASGNLVVGAPLVLQGAEDILMGRMAASQQTGQRSFLQTDNNPNSVQVTGRKLKSRSNPIALLFSDFSGFPTADITQSAIATADNQIVGLRPLPGIYVPALPIAILLRDLQSGRPDTWEMQIDQELGADMYKYDHTTHKVSMSPDDIREIRLVGADPNDDNSGPPNVCQVDVGSGLKSSILSRQFEEGLSVDDFKSFPGRWLLPSEPRDLRSDTIFDASVMAVLRRHLGEARVCFVYEALPGMSREEQPYQVRCVGLVAGRFMEAIKLPRQAPQFFFQPAVMITRTALTAADDEVASTGAARDAKPNKYIYKVSLTR